MNHNFKELIIWKLAFQISKDSYKLVESFPNFEKYDLSSQMRRAAVSIPSNIAEGCGRGTDPQLIHFIDIALGSSCELETQVLLARDFGYCSEELSISLLDKINEFQRRTRHFRNKIVNN